MGQLRERSERKIFTGPQEGPQKLKVNCLVVILKIMFKWYNVVAINIAD